VQVGRLVLDHEGEQLGEIHYNPPGRGGHGSKEALFLRWFSTLWQQLPDNLQAVKARIQRAAMAARRDPAAVTLLAVSKTHPATLVRRRSPPVRKPSARTTWQEALEKMDALRSVPGVEWHLIGPLQSNKTRLAAERFDWVHTVGSEKIARRLSEQRPAGMAPAERAHSGERFCAKRPSPGFAERCFFSL